MRNRNNSVLVYGIGINDADYVTCPRINGKTVKCKIYSAWSSMLQRCYSKKVHLQHQTYIGCSVDSNWHRFSNFREWMIKQDWEGKQLDKDILVQGNKIYSPDTCCFIGSEINCVVLYQKSSRGGLPIGCTKFRNGYMSHCRIGSVKTYLGYYIDPMMCHVEWQKVKSDYVDKLAHLQKDERIKAALMFRVSQIRDDLVNNRETTKL